MKRLILVLITIIGFSCSDDEPIVIIPKQPEIDIIGVWKINTATIVSTAKYNVGNNCITVSTPKQIFIPLRQVEYEFQMENRLVQLKYCPEKLFYYYQYTLKDNQVSITTGEVFSLSYNGDNLMLKRIDEDDPDFVVTYSYTKI